ncbi:MAG: bifunctional folylpolyglutamate synthase/dihydrofolate synthase [Candidatus Methanoplasma sp.]|nr:bifunctional folylpolyglutamate synthase/dihydrofolate synthase [Candidatus Methanoplasma sp.]
MENISELLSRIGDPQKSFSGVHVAGSDGKGSVCACIHAILRSSGIRTGLYTSPHIADLNERMLADGEHVTDSELSDLAALVYPIVEEMGSQGRNCTYFDVTTAMAFLFFKTKNVEYAVIEVGMGGRLDSTNVVIPKLCVIGNVSMEHTEFLGNTIERIAFEKAGIMKPNVPCVTVNDDDVYDVLKRVAEERGTPLMRVLTSDIHVEESRSDGVRFAYKGADYNLPIPGRHQALNAVMAIEASRLLSLYGEERPLAVKEGLNFAEWPCRMQLVGDFVIDVTHTAAGADRLAADVAELYGEVVTVFGVLRDKDIDRLSRDLALVSRKVFVAPLPTERSADPACVAEAMRRYTADVETSGSVSEAMDAAVRESGGLKVLVTGSFYTAAEAVRHLGGMQKVRRKEGA